MRPPQPRSHSVAQVCFALLVSLSLGACGGEEDNQNLVLKLVPQAPERMGFITVTGTVTTSKPIPKGARVVFGMTVGRPSARAVFDESVDAQAPAETTTIALRIESMRAGEAYSFFVGVDLNQDGMIGVADLGGYFDGSTVLPFVDPSTARLIPIRRNFNELDFGVGEIR